MANSGGRSFTDKVNFIWSVADLLRGDYKQSDYGKVILPFTVIRRLDCVMEDTRAVVVARAEQLTGKVNDPDQALQVVAGREFYNTSPLTFEKLAADPANVATNLRQYLLGFSPGAQEVIAKFRFEDQITKLDDADLLYQVVGKFAGIDLHTDVVDNDQMGYLYEELIRRFSEQSNETAGEHFTPREVIRLMVDLLFIEDDSALRGDAAVRTLFDPACGTGGMLAVASDRLGELNPSAHLEVYGQELNDESFAMCRSDLMLKGQRSENVQSGNSFSQDRFVGRRFDYLLANPPFGVEWKKVQEAVKTEARNLGFGGRFGAGLPRINDGSLLFLQHMISKMKPTSAGGSRLAIVFNGSPLFTGAAGSGESEIRRWIIENDWLEAVVALPDQLFYNTGISTYFWIVSNRKRPERQGKVQLVDARDLWEKMPKSLGDKRKRISDDQIAEIVRLYGDFTEGDRVKIFPNESFGFQRITVERPLKIRYVVTDETIAVVEASKVFSKLGEVTQQVLLEVLGSLRGTSEPSVERFEARFVPEAIRVWVDHDWPTEEGEVGDLAWSLDITQAQARAILSALARPDPNGEPVRDARGALSPDPSSRDQENVPLPEGTPEWDEADDGAAKRLADPVHQAVVDAYVKAEIHPWVPDAWVDHTKTKIGYEIPLTRHFYQYVPPRPLEEIDAELKALEAEVLRLLAEVTE